MAKRKDRSFDPEDVADQIVRAAIEAGMLNSTGGVTAFHALVVNILRANG